MTDRKYRTHASLRSFMFLFIIILFAVACSIILFSYLYSRYGGGVKTAVLILVNLIILSVICSLAEFMRRKFTVERRVKEILSATDRITSGDFEVNIGSSGRRKADEFDVIAGNINKMALELKKNESLKRDFTVNLSHEIKTPLAIIANYAEKLNGELTESERREYSENLLTATNRLVNLTGDVLRLSRLENSVIKPPRQLINLTRSAEDCIIAFEDKIEKKNIDLDCDLEDVTIYADEGNADLVINNLISNAVKFTDEGGEIKITLKEEGDFAVFSVKDNGCGMSEETGSRIFEKFYQGDTSHASEGNGLGLALVKRIIDIMGGGIDVSSEPGKGSTFTVRFPKGVGQ